MRQYGVPKPPPARVAFLFSMMGQHLLYLYYILNHQQSLNQSIKIISYHHLYHQINNQQEASLHRTQQPNGIRLASATGPCSGRQNSLRMV